MANKTFGTLKIDSLRDSDHYNSNDSTLLELAGRILNDVLSEIQSLSRESLFWKDLDNTVSTTADQAYVDLSDTDILEITSVYQRETDTRLKRVNRRQYTQVFPDTTNFSGTPELAYDVEQNLTAGVNTFRIYLMPTPSAVVTIRYDYIKNARFSADGTGADSEYSPLPDLYNPLILAMFKPKFFSIIDSENRARIITAREDAEKQKSMFLPMLNSKSDFTQQARSYRDRGDVLQRRVKTTPAP